MAGKSYKYHIGSIGTDPADWTAANPPWSFLNIAEVTAGWPSDINYVNIQTGSSDFYTNLKNTVDAASGRIVVVLGAGVYSFNQFRLIGSSGDPTYSFGYWDPKLKGFLGQGATQTFIQMDANSMSGAQLAALGLMTQASFAPNQMGLMRVDGSPSDPVYIGALTIRAADQQNLTSKASDVAIFIPQPAPHHGLVFYSNSAGTISHVRFQGAGRACYSQPPFEHANATSQLNSLVWRNCEFDGRRSPDLDPAIPRRCGVVMMNNEYLASFTDCWFHHSNVSRYAANDQNANTTGTYSLTRCKSEQITNTQNTDPAINGGLSLGGYTNASLFGWESCNGTINIVDCLFSQDNTQSAGQNPMHLQLTTVGSRNPQGGRMNVYGGTFHNTGFPSVEGFLCFRITPDTYWYTDGFDTTLRIYQTDHVTRLTSHLFSGTWPPTTSYLLSNGLAPSTHFLIRLG